jgi:hypothetical protein
MQPDQGPHPDYDFILNPSKQGKKSLFGGSSKKQRLLMTIIAGGIGLVLVFIVLGVVFGGGSGSEERLNGLVQQQTELIRVAGLADKDAADANAKNLATTVELSLTSAKTKTTTALTKGGGKLQSKQLGAKKDADTDKALAAAKQANRFDEVFMSTMKTELTDYQSELKDFYDTTDSKSEKALLQQLYKEAGALLQFTQ